MSKVSASKTRIDSSNVKVGTLLYVTTVLEGRGMGPSVFMESLSRQKKMLIFPNNKMEGC